MPLPFVDRQRELQRLQAALERGGGLLCVYGRRRLGKTRLIRELCRGRRAVYYVGDERDAALQQSALAREISRLVPGFAEVSYPDWSSLLMRCWRELAPEHVLVLDELPSLVTQAPELPSVLQKLVDESPRPVILCGSSQRMMHGLVLDGSAPLYGRASEILRIEPLSVHWLGKALRLSAHDAVEQYAVWGGVPRYWELALAAPSFWDALNAHVLDPLGVLHREPDRLLLDETTDIARAASVLSLVARGCHRSSEIGRRLGVPATALARPLARLIDLGLLVRDLPFGSSIRDTKRTLYRVGDPFLRFWFRFVDPNRSRLVAGQLEDVLREIRSEWKSFVAATWEELARESVAKSTIAGQSFRPAARWWGRDRAGAMLEIDVVARSSRSDEEVLVGEVKVTCSSREIPRALAKLRAKAERCPLTAGKRTTLALWVLGAERGRSVSDGIVLGPSQVVRALR